jgi:hypothetical protein
MIGLAGQRSRLLLGIGMRDSDQDHQAGAGEAADRGPGYRYARLDGTLNHSSHEKAFFPS